VTLKNLLKTETLVKLSIDTSAENLKRKTYIDFMCL